MEKIHTNKKREKEDEEALISNVEIDEEAKQENNYCISFESGNAAMNLKELSAAAAIVRIALNITAIGSLGVIVSFPYASAQDMMAGESMTASGRNMTSSDIIDGEVANITSTGTEEEQEAKNINTVNQLREALNTGDVSRVHEFISPEYFNHESQMDPVRSNLEVQKSL